MKSCQQSEIRIREPFGSTMDKLHGAIQVYVEGFYLYHDHLRKRSLQFRIPIIVLSALTTGVSFINVAQLSSYVSMAAGIMTLAVTILTGVEGYLKLPQHTNATENALKNLGRLSRKAFALMSSGAPVTHDVIEKMFQELASCIDEAPIIPARMYIKFKPLIRQRILYSSFDPAHPKSPREA
jgi:hypothetical protein